MYNVTYIVMYNAVQCFRVKISSYKSSVYLPRLTHGICCNYWSL